jgi:Zn-dependent oligopeptidase
LKPSFISEWESVQNHAQLNEKLLDALRIHDLFYYGRRYPLIKNNVEPLAHMNYLSYSHVLQQLMHVTREWFGLQFTVRVGMKNKRIM